MKMLCLEFSSQKRTVALAGRQADESFQVMASASDEGKAFCRPLQLIDAVLRQRNLSPEAIEAIAVGLGPGSYTGVRSAIAVAQGWQLAKDLPLFGVSSMDCLAAEAQRRSWFGRVHLVIDAQRDEFYHAVYEVGRGELNVVSPLHLASLAEIGDVSREPGAILAGPEIKQRLSGARLLFPEAETLVSLVRLGSPRSSGDAMEPIYLRKAIFVKAPPSKPILR
jgi:tRNA threonylcarbamoyladenosine biosynthesis protein TsaB